MDTENDILSLVTDFFTGLGIVTTKLSLNMVGDDINIFVETPDSPLLIGIHGKSIESFQHLLSRMIEKKIHSFVHVHLEVNDYVKQKDDKLFRFLDTKIASVMAGNHSIQLPSLSPYERKKAHGYIAEKHISGLKTESKGEGIERVLILSYSGEQKVYSQSQSKTSSHDLEMLSDDGVGI